MNKIVLPLAKEGENSHWKGKEKAKENERKFVAQMLPRVPVAGEDSWRCVSRLTEEEDMGNWCSR